MLRSLVFAVAFYVTTAIFLTFGLWLLIAPRSWAMQALQLHGHACTWLLGAICGTRLEIRGREKIPEGACLVIAKHQSAWDSFGLLPFFADPAIVTKAELKWIPVYGWFCVKFAHILVRRERAAAALKLMVKDARDRARDGRQILIFPEGTRRVPGDTPDYKPGYVALYEALGIPAVPLALNSGLYWPRRRLDRFPGTIIVEILDTLPPGMPRAEFRRTIESRIEAACDRLIAEAAAATDAPPMPPEAVARLEQIKNRT